jgi:hypothetical protein
MRYDLLQSCGANSVRIHARKSILDNAQAHGFTAMAGLPVRGERDGMDWDDESMVREQAEGVLRAVEELKDHPAVLFWNIGNELDWIPPGRPYNPRIWQHLNDLAKSIHKIDPHHPVMTVVGISEFDVKMQEMARDCPDIDFIGLNPYGDIAEAAALARKHWPKPYAVTEWGPTGHWQVKKTAWGAPIEETSTEKAQSYYERYKNVILADATHCVGSYVFLWGQHQETTHTWYGLFRDGMATEAIDAMTFHWSGAWPLNRAPVVLDLRVEGYPDIQKLYLEPDTTYAAAVTVYDPDHDDLAFAWDIRTEVVSTPETYAGNNETASVPITDLIESGKGANVTFRTPKESGPYRLCVQVTDKHDHAGYANRPFFVRSGGSIIE